MQCKDVSFASSAKKYSWQEMCYAVSGNTEEKIAIFQPQDKKSKEASLLPSLDYKSRRMSWGWSEFPSCNGSC